MSLILLFLVGFHAHASTLRSVLQSEKKSPNCQSLLTKFSGKYPDFSQAPELFDSSNHLPIDVTRFVWIAELVPDVDPHEPGEPFFAQRWITREVIPGNEGDAMPVATSISLTATIKPSQQRPSPRIRIEFSAKRFVGERDNETLKQEMKELLTFWYMMAVFQTKDPEAPSLDVFLNIMTKISIQNSGTFKRINKRIMFAINSRVTTKFIIRFYEIALSDLGLD